jgi:hypothetical protein
MGVILVTGAMVIGFISAIAALTQFVAFTRSAQHK